MLTWITNKIICWTNAHYDLRSGLTASTLMRNAGQRGFKLHTCEGCWNGMILTGGHKLEQHSFQKNAIDRMQPIL